MGIPAPNRVGSSTQGPGLESFLCLPNQETRARHHQDEGCHWHQAGRREESNFENVKQLQTDFHKKGGNIHCV